MWANQRVRRRNNTRRYDSLEEKEFTLAAAAGLFLMWSPYSPSDEIKEESSLENKQVGLPAEIGQLIGHYLNRKNGASVAQVCRNANKLALEARDSYVKNHGKSYEEESYTPLMFFY